MFTWDRDNPFRHCFTRNKSVSVSSLRLDELLRVKQDPHFFRFTRSPLPWISRDTYWHFSLIKRFRYLLPETGVGGICWDTDWAWIRMECLQKLLESIVSLKVRAYVKDYCKRNGLLTLSVFAVVTGCVLGFILRSFNLSTQVWIDGWMDVNQTMTKWLT